MSKQAEHFVKGQWICDNNECRQKIHQQIEKLNDEFKNDFQKIFRENSSKNRVDENRGWKIVRSIGEKLSKTLTSNLKNDQIVSIVDEFGENAFRHEFRFELEKSQETTIGQDQLWNIYQRICRDAIETLSKSSIEHGTK